MTDVDFTAFVERCRLWREENKDWELICDIKNSDKLYESFEDLPKRRKKALITRYRDDAEYCYYEFENIKCKCDFGFLNDDMEICEKFPNGRGMMVFKTNGKSY